MWSTDLKHNSSWCSSVSDCWTPLAPDPSSLSADSDHTLLKNIAMLVHPARNGRAGRNKLNRFPARKTALHARVISPPPSLPRKTSKQRDADRPRPKTNLPSKTLRLDDSMNIERYTMKCHGRFSLSSARSDRQKVQKPPNCAQSKPGESPAVSRAVGRSVGCFDIDVKTTSARLALLLLSRSFQPLPVLSGGGYMFRDWCT